MTHIEGFGKKSSDKPEKEKKLLSRCAAQVLGGLALLSHVCYSKSQISLSKFLGSQPGKWWIKKRLSWEGVGSQGAERKWFRSQQAAAGPGLDLSWSHQVSHSFLKAGLGFFACFQFSTRNFLTALSQWGVTSQQLLPARTSISSHLVPQRDRKTTSHTEKTLRKLKFTTKTNSPN